METLLWVGGVAAVLYGAVGCVMAFYEKSQTDDPWNWKIVVKWPLIFFGFGR